MVRALPVALAQLISLVDFFTSVIFLVVGRCGAVTGLEKAEQLLLVALGQRIRSGRLGHACGLQLIQQGFG